MAWYAPTVTDVLEEFTESEVATLNNLLGGSANITLKLGAILQRTVAEIRGYIRSGDYKVDQTSAATVPASMITDAIAITRWRFLVAAPQLKQLQTDERRDVMLNSLVKLRSVAAQNFAPDSPTDADDSGFGAQGGSWNSENKIIMRTHPVPKPATQWTPQTDTYANPDAPADATPEGTQPPSSTSGAAAVTSVFGRSGNVTAMEQDYAAYYASVGSSLQSTPYKYGSSTASGDPGNGKLRFDSLTPSAIAHIYLSKLNVGNNDISAMLGLIKSGDIIAIQDQNNAADALRFNVSGAPVNNTTWWSIPVTYVTSQGAMPANNDGLLLTVYMV